MLFLTSKFCLLMLCCTKTDTTTRHNTHFCCEGHQSSSHEGSRLLKSSTCLSSGSLARERIAPSGMSSPCRQQTQTTQPTNKQTSAAAKVSVHGLRNMQEGNGHAFVLDPVEVSDVPRLALTTNSKRGWNTLRCSGELSVLSSFPSCIAAIPGGSPVTLSPGCTAFIEKTYLPQHAVRHL